MFQQELIQTPKISKFWLLNLIIWILFTCSWSQSATYFQNVDIEATYLGPGEYIYLSFSVSDHWDHFRVTSLSGNNIYQEVNASESMPAANAPSGTSFYEGTSTLIVLLSGTDPALFLQKFNIRSYLCPRTGLSARPSTLLLSWLLLRETFSVSWIVCSTGYCFCLSRLSRDACMYMWIGLLSLCMFKSSKWYRNWFENGIGA